MSCVCVCRVCACTCNSESFWLHTKLFHDLESLFFQDLYGIDWQGPVSQYEDIEHVEVPQNTLNLTSQQLMELQQSVHPLEECDDLGVSQYVAASSMPVFK